MLKYGRLLWGGAEPSSYNSSSPWVVKNLPKKGKLILFDFLARNNTAPFFSSGPRYKKSAIINYFNYSTRQNTKFRGLNANNSAAFNEIFKICLCDSFDLYGDAFLPEKTENSLLYN